MADLIRVDREARQAWQGETLLDLSPMKYRLLDVLVSNAGRLMPVSALLRDVWDTDLPGMRGTVFMTLVRLRKVLGDDAVHPVYITTVRGQGVRFEACMVAAGETRTVDIDGRRYEVLHWERRPSHGSTPTFTLHAREVTA